VPSKTDTFKQEREEVPRKEAQVFRNFIYRKVTRGMRRNGAEFPRSNLGEVLERGYKDVSKSRIFRRE